MDNSAEVDLRFVAIALKAIFEGNNLSEINSMLEKFHLTYRSKYDGFDLHSKKNAFSDLLIEINIGGLILGKNGIIEVLRISDLDGRQEVLKEFNAEFVHKYLLKRHAG